jgi:release factor glutamine methyltransferase
LYLTSPLPGSFEKALQSAKQILRTSHRLTTQNLIDTEAEQLLQASYRAVTGKSLSRLELFSNLRTEFPVTATEVLLNMAESRAQGMPLAYVIGYQAFGENEYEVSADVLIPRPETEFLLSTVIETLSSHSLVPKLGLEIGIGSGVLSIELLFRYRSLIIYGSELNRESQRIADTNALRILGPEIQNAKRFRSLHANHPSAVWEPFEELRRIPNFQSDFIITNPPYLISEDQIESEVLKYEPKQALFAPAHDPLYFYRKVCFGAEEYLRAGGYVFAEVPHERSKEILELFKGPKWEAEILPDLTLRDRVLVARLKESHG